MKAKTVIIFFLLIIPAGGLWPQLASLRPLPEVDEFVREIRKTLLKENEVVRNYVYRVRSSATGFGLDMNEEFEVYHFQKCPECSQDTNFNAVQYYFYPFKNHTYEKLIRGDAPPEPRDDVNATNGAGIKIELMNEAKSQRGLTAEEERRRGEADIDEIFSLYYPRILRREVLDGQSAIVMNFTPRKDVKPKSSVAKFARHMEAKVWIHEEEHEIMRIEAEAIDNIGFAGPLAKIEKGMKVVQERRKVNNEVWLPYRTESNYKFKLLFVVGSKVREVEELYGFRKFAVDTKVTYEQKEE